MKLRIFCTCCRKEIPHSEMALKYENSLFDGKHCLNVFKKLKAVYGDGFRLCRPYKYILINYVKLDLLFSRFIFYLLLLLCLTGPQNLRHRSLPIREAVSLGPFIYEILDVK